MQHNYDFHLHHQLVDASQMLQEFEIFYDNTNVHSVYGMTAGISSECHAQLLLWSSFTMVYTLKFKEKDFWLFSKKLMGKGENFCFSIPSPRENLETYAKQSQRYEAFTIRHDLIFEPFDSYLPSAVYQGACNITAR